MSVINSATCDTWSGRPPLSTLAVRHSAGWEVREEGEYYIPDPMEDEDYEPDPELFEAAEAHTEEQREAMALLDDAENLLAVLLASIEDKADDRAAQTEAVLKVVKKKLKKAHTRIDRQDDRHRTMLLAYFELKARFEKVQGPKALSADK